MNSTNRAELLDSEPADGCRTCELARVSGSATGHLRLGKQIGIGKGSL